MEHPGLDGWPVIEIDVREMSRGAGHDAAFGALAAALERGGRFAAVVLPSATAGNEPGGAGRLAHVRWLKANRAALAERCAGIAFVMSAELRGASAKLLAVGTKIVGCPVTACESPEQAQTWARDRLAARPEGRA